MEKRNVLIKNVHMQVGKRSAKVPQIEKHGLEASSLMNLRFHVVWLPLLKK